MQPPDFLKIFISPLEQEKYSYFITGSVAAIFYGEPRLTHDIDIVIHLPDVDMSRFFAQFPFSEFYSPPEEVVRIESRRKPYGHFNLIHHQSGLKADVYIGADDKLHQWAFENRKRIDMKDGFAIWVAPAEYVIIRKLEYFREGGSQKHIEDIRKMLPQVREDLDSLYLERELEVRGLTSFWQNTKGVSG